MGCFVASRVSVVIDYLVLVYPRVMFLSVVSYYSFLRSIVDACVQDVFCCLFCHPCFGEHGNAICFASDFLRV